MTSEGFKNVRSTLIFRENGTPYLEFRRKLKPRYLRAWLDIALGWAALFACLSLTALGISRGGWSEALALGFGTLSMGYWVAYLQLFLHESAHFLLAKSKRQNDFISDITVGCLTGQSVAAYRAIHFDHHRYIGTTRDAERSYFNSLTPWFFFASLSGIRTLQVIIYRRSIESPQKTQSQKLWTRARVVACLLHGSLFLLLILLHVPLAILAWLAGILIVFPFLAGLRQLLEHRSLEANPAFDYARIDHGEVQRIFNPGIFSSTFGAAGFNRHLIHHWEPQVSYTNLAELERFLMGTQLGGFLSSAKTSYGRTFLCLLNL